MPLLIEYLGIAGPNEPLRQAFQLQVALWDDDDSDAAWVLGTRKRSNERRTAIYDALDIPASERGSLTTWFPISLEQNLIISEEYEPWYTPELQQQRQFYWPAYEDYLLRHKGWGVESVSELSSATTDVVRRLSDPARHESFQSKGLVVGYVQSGKTANIAGVLAKAIDSGYRLLIVMTGTIDLLREQTQRRLDMELVGSENILRNIDPDDIELLSTVDYQDDPEWPKFLKHGVLPSKLNRPDVIRLTNHRFSNRTGDYRRLLTGITALEFEKWDNSLPLNDPKNLYRCSARLAVVKKNATVLRRLVTDLKTIRPLLGEIPALIIDDESDLASVNTRNPAKWNAGKRERTAINKLIADILELLPRAQYIGYTATPFANVFVDPDDSQDIFPKDYVVALRRPPGYMGALDFHDLDSDLDDDGNIVPGPKERAHIRDLNATEEQAAERQGELLHALRMYVLSGAIKLWRQSTYGMNFRHHTMLVHESVKQVEHQRLAQEINTAWRTAAFNSPTGVQELRHLYEADVVPTSALVGDNALPDEFDELAPHLAEAVRKMTEGSDVAIIVNSNRDMATEEVDFDKREVWRVLVGGAKLSRGFTIEGLTVSYYRRKTHQSDTLMQMGRWFGFRNGYRDLVRLYIDRNVETKSRAYDLYEAFGAVVLAEEEFRAELRRYAELVDGRPQITPAQVAPLVTQHLPWLRPTAPNKMFNAYLEVRRLQEIEPVAYPTVSADIAHNSNVMLSLVRQATSDVILMFPQKTNLGSYQAKLGLMSHEAVLESLALHRWGYSDHFEADLAFLQESASVINDWAIVVPLLNTTAVMDIPEYGRVGVSYRRRQRDPLFQNISDPKHREALRKIAGIPTKAQYQDSAAENLAQPGRGAILLHPITELKLADSEVISKETCIFAMRIVPPASARRDNYPYVSFKVRDGTKAEEPIIAVTGTDGA
ncbi:Z1 domain-containing protein [Candidatus Poriferisodalis sp.]|uniref:Z1 domain-containing protein n=1 Tax=Candidatus Poriferisodalis sp. TaxID=3101277 RepID=UPI003B01BB32